MDSKPKPPIYPAYCHHRSPTRNVWCPLFAADIQALRQEDGYDGQNTYFHLNHPIKFVYVVGVIIDVTSFENHYSGKRIIITLDDSSGETIDAITKLPATQPLEKVQSQDSVVTSPEETAKALSPGFDFDNLDNNIGRTVKIKGLLEIFRQSIQVSLRQHEVVRDSDAEIEFWKKATYFKSHVLRNPWQLSEDQVRLCRKGAETNERKVRRKRKRETSEEKPKPSVPETASERAPLVTKADSMTAGIRNAKANEPRQDDEYWKCSSRTCGKFNQMNETRCSLCGLARKALKVNGLTKVVWAGEETLLGNSNKPTSSSTVSTTEVSINVPGPIRLENWPCPSRSCGYSNKPGTTNCGSCGISRKPFSNKSPKNVGGSITEVWVGEAKTPPAKPADRSCLPNKTSNQTQPTRSYSPPVSIKYNTKPITSNKASVIKQPGSGNIERKFQVRPGDWTCPSCGKNVYARLSECFNCKTSRPIPKTSQQSRRNFEEPTSQHHSVDGGKIQVKSGDWSCPNCGNHVFGSKSKCPRCSTTRTMPQSKKSFSETGSGSETTSRGKSGDWSCPNCGNLVFGSKSKCPRCSTTRPVPSTGRQSSAIPTGTQVKSGDWTCTRCGGNNWARNAACFKCSADHMTGLKEAKFQVRDRDWSCGSCGRNNYASQKACYKCSREREKMR